MRALVAVVLVGCVAPPAKPEGCRDDISLAYAGRALLQLAHDTLRFDPRARDARYAEREAPLAAFSTQMYLRDRTIAQCIGHQWPANVVGCYRDVETFEDCARELPHDDCLALEGAVDIYDDIHPRLCGEPPRRRPY
jgi:hypothetical protein